MQYKRRILSEEQKLEKRNSDKTISIIAQDEARETKILIRQVESKKIQQYKENLPKVLQEKNEEIVSEIKELVESMPENKKVPLEPIVMRLLKKQLSGMGQQPIYDARELAIVFEYYQQMVQDLLLQGISILPSRQNFAAFAGISANTFDTSYLKSNDLEKRKVASSIEDYFIECSWSGAKQNKLNSYAVEKYSKLQGIGGGYIEPKVSLELKQNNITLDSPEAMAEKLEELRKNLLAQK